MHDSARYPDISGRTFDYLDKFRGKKMTVPGHDLDTSGGVLSSAQRKKLPAKSFAIPGKRPESGSYPIPDESHARNALARVSQHGSPAEKARVRAAVKKKFPGIGQKKGD